MSTATRSRLNRPGPVPTALTYLWLGVAAVVLLFPVLLTVVGGFLPSSALLHQPPRLFGGDWTLDNYAEAWNQPVVPLAPAFANSLFVGLVIMAGHLVTSCLAGYALVFLRTPLRTPLFWLFLATIMVPYESIVVPNALFVRSLGLGDNRLSLVLPFLANGFGVFLLRQAFQQFPRELREAAVIDGCGHLRFLFTILLPSCRPALTALAVWSFLQGWNMYFWPLIIASGDNSMNTLQSAVFALKNNEGASPAVLLAGISITLIPTLLLVVFGQRWLVRGFTAGAVK
ncbi:carbohydrate ABC transporter permease [Goodfellowiella coeruleoviolacea]|uniref:Sn-glycerol 3-phosphate transport system permease protein n=1 Tax=Goodfellowiella coeruleoviolacea TaxID=334858 RepID=A0AAE3GMB3_9PSEU|nr:carbohydrate ABC transporter permease [Goodfellowiella coeruleoviolacea]MCP2169914.1 sn-glycerol 3-phosphate transport system permease protein [Goodfellowiella coeruleoviolacea]